MLAKNILNSLRLGRLIPGTRATFCTVGAMLAALCLAGSSADAGVMIPWAQTGAAAPELLVEVVHFGSNGCTASSVPDVPPSNPIEQRARVPVDTPLMGLLAGDGGGATAPVGGSVFQASAVVLAICETFFTHLTRCTYRFLCDLDPQLSACYGRGIFRPPRFVVG